MRLGGIITTDWEDWIPNNLAFLPVPNLLFQFLKGNVEDTMPMNSYQLKCIIYFQTSIVPT